MEGFYLPDGRMHYVRPDDTVILGRPEAGLNLDKQFDRLEQAQAIHLEAEPWKDKVELTIQTPSPYFCLLPLSDFHLGDYGTDYEEVRAKLAYLKEYPVYTVLVGDIGNFFMPARHPEGMLNQAPPDWQVGLLRQFFEEYRDKILAVVSSPSHHEWLRSMAGIDADIWLTRNLGIPLLESGGVLQLDINDQTYSGLLFHQIKRFTSSYNLTHAGKQALRFHGNADFVIDAHRHQGAMEQTFMRGEKATIVRLGTTKVEDKYGTRSGYLGRPFPFYPTMFFDARRKNIELVEDQVAAEEIIEAMDYLSRMRAVAFLGSLEE